MTVEERYLVDLADVKAIRFECGSCGTAVSLKASEWKAIPYNCPACSVQWHYGPETPQFQTLNKLAVGWSGAAAIMKGDAPFRLRLELDRPKI